MVQTTQAPSCTLPSEALVWQHFLILQQKMVTGSLEWWLVRKVGKWGSEGRHSPNRIYLTYRA